MTHFRFQWMLTEAWGGRDFTLIFTLIDQLLMSYFERTCTAHLGKDYAESSLYWVILQWYAFLLTYLILYSMTVLSFAAVILSVNRARRKKETWRCFSSEIWMFHSLHFTAFCYFYFVHVLIGSCFLVVVTFGQNTKTSITNPLWTLVMITLFFEDRTRIPLKIETDPRDSEETCGLP